MVSIMKTRTLDTYDINVFSALKGQKLKGILTIEDVQENNGKLILQQEDSPLLTLQEYIDEGISLRAKERWLKEILEIIRVLHHHHPRIILGTLDTHTVYITDTGSVKLEIPSSATVNGIEKTDVQCIGHLMNTMFPTEEYTALAQDCIQGNLTCVEEVMEAIDAFKRTTVPTGINIPGFRSGVLWHKIVTVIAYLIIVLASFTGEVEWDGVIVDNVLFCCIYRLLMCLVLLSIVDVSTHWTTVFDGFPWMQDPNPFKKFLGCCISVMVVLLISTLILIGLDKILL